MEKTSKRTGNTSNTRFPNKDSSTKPLPPKMTPKKQSEIFSEELDRKLKFIIETLRNADKPWELIEKRIEDQFEEGDEEE